MGVLLLLAGCGEGDTVTLDGTGGTGTAPGTGGASVTCAPGQTSCGSACVDLASSLAHCGACGRSCGAGRSCVSGTCTCSASLTECAGACVDLKGDGSHCGACNVACSAGQVCAAGTCQSVCAVAGQSVCGSSCVDLSGDVANCGSCGQVCAAGQTCSGGACVCQPGLVDCNGSCVDLQSNGSHCGTCTTVCIGQVCANGVCSSSCPTGQTACGASCVDLQTDVANCGSCGVACAAGQSCQSGACGCQGGLVDCGGTCVDLSGSGTNCGACGNTCSAGQVCSAGVCEGACSEAGQTVCGTSCVDLATDLSNCGSCGAVCTGTSCQGGICVCASGQQLCGGICTDVTSNTLHCGSCGNACATSQLCMSGSCTSGTGGAGGGGESTGGATTGTGGSVQATGGTTGGTGRLVGDTCYPLCASSSSDPEGDGWGWENDASCIVTGSSPYNQGAPCDASTGGASTGGASTGGASTGGASTGGSSGCGAEPVNPNATATARNLLCYLYSIYGSNVLSGQQETSWDNPESDISWYNTNVGKYPAVLGGDYLYPDGTTNRAIAYWNAGGIPMIRYHMGAPPNSDTYQNSQGSANIGNVLASGTNENRSFISKLDYVATELQRLQDANVAVLWAPFHEYQPNGWFWWSKGSASEFIQLWRYMFDYLTDTKGLDNLVWLAPSSGNPNASWYPGKDYIDVAGPDTYETNQPFTSMFNSARNIIGTTVPITLHETGTIPQPSSMFPTAAPWVLWSVWAGYQVSDNSLSSIRSAYESSYTITRDEVPDLN